MVYLDHFTFPDAEEEFDFGLSVKRRCYNTFYPFGVLSKHHFERIDFEPITILSGSNGSGKSTALHVIAGKLGLPMYKYNRSSFFENYLSYCHAEWNAPLPADSALIRSDDVFDTMLALRGLNEEIDQTREKLFSQYLKERESTFQLKSIDDYETLRRYNQAHSHTQSRYVRENLMENVRERSNGESAFHVFVEKIGENALYLLDEPENSLAPARQKELAAYIEAAARFDGCQFILATHSPYFLSLRGAKIYDLDADPVDLKPWTELDSVREMYTFFRDHRGEFGE